MGAYPPELFVTRYRCTGAGIAYSAAGIADAGSSWPVSAYVLAVGAVSALCLLLLRETEDDALDR